MTAPHQRWVGNLVRDSQARLCNHPETRRRTEVPARGHVDGNVNRRFLYPVMMDLFEVHRDIAHLANFGNWCLWTHCAYWWNLFLLGCHAVGSSWLSAQRLSYFDIHVFETLDDFFGSLHHFGVFHEMLLNERPCLFLGCNVSIILITRILHA